MRPAERILVIKLSALGDMILALPALARIRAAHPHAHITLLTTPPFESLGRACPSVDTVETDGRPRGVRAWLALIRRLRRARYARIYDLQGNDRTNLMFQALRPFPPAWSGVAFGCALPHRNRARMRLHSLERHAEQLRDAGAWPDAPVAPLAAPPPDVAWMTPDLPPRTGGERRILLVPGAAARRPAKRWPAERYAELAARLSALGYAVDVLGSVDESDLARTIKARAPAARDLTGATTLFQLAARGARCTLAVGNDTGPMHLLAAAGAPCVSLFSADSDPALSAPRGRVTVLREADLRNLPVDIVFAACERALAAG